ncbi:MAG: hypothetical protein METHP_00350 [Methanoregula sp. SKADARSKE-2]|nr:MAG: hypothetical protein METHP_00350 [Methanoregula sp. SKADARSKE-2]
MHGSYRTTSGRDSGKIRTSGLSFIASEKVKAPTLDDVVVSLECVVIYEFITGDHTVFVGRVVAARGNPEETACVCKLRVPGFALDNTMEGTADEGRRCGNNACA